MRENLGAGAVFIGVAGLVAANWAVWLGWDQRYNEHPDGSVSGPYEAWQVIGLIVVMAVVLIAFSLRGPASAVVLGAPTGMAIASFADWSDDGSGLFIVGVGA